MTGDPHILHPDHAPTPFTADEIRAGCPAGRTIRMSVRGEGGSHTRVIRFVACSDDGASQESRAFTEAGEPLGEPTIHWSSWSELQEHASFLQSVTSIEPEALNSPMGRLECRIYTVAEEASVTRYWFAVLKPGMPVKFEKQVDGEIALAWTMIEDEIS